MCGFVGIHRRDGGPIDQAELLALAATMAHRGPDGWGSWAEGPVGLAHRRLAIIDPAGSPQPMASVDGHLHVAFNGEVLNHRQLRARHAYPYRTAGDTEALLAVHHARGIDGVQELRGQFAYALHDGRTGETWLVRDRLGILPLHYVEQPGFVAFASEVKALLPLLASPTVDEDSLDAYLRRRAVPAPHTLVAGVRKLPPGHVARIGRDGEVEVRRWWSPQDVAVRDLDDRTAVDAVEAALVASVDEHLIADVPVGCYLSGGLDSSLITALAAERTTAGPLHTFSAGFGDDRLDETPHARLVAEALATRHHEVVVGPEGFADSWRRLTWHRDAPLSEPADVAVHHLALAASAHVKVVLSGEGADELFAGYPKHRMARASSLPVPGPARRGLDHLQRVAPPELRRARVALRALSEATPDARMDAWFSPFTAEERRALLGPDRGRPAPPAPGAAGSPLRRMLLADTGSWLSDNLLERGDRMTMAASVELRPPFLDERLVDLALSLPDRVKLRRGEGKWVLRQVARGRVPAAIAARPKSGFKVPLDRWFRGGLRDMAWDLLTSPGSFAAEVFDAGEVRRLLERHDRGRADEDIRLWTLVGLELWHEATFTPRDRPGRPVGAVAS